MSGKPAERSEELTESSRKWWESLCSHGKATACPGCGRFTKSKSGFCPSCEKEFGISRKRKA